MTAIAIPAHTTEERLMAASVLVASYNVTADEVTVNSDGIHLRGVSIQTISDIAPALALAPSDTVEYGYEGSTLDGIPVFVEQSR